MLVRLSVCLGDSRRTVEDGQNMGGINYTFKTKLTADETSVAPVKDRPPTTYKSITKVGPEEYPGTSRLATICHTCGIVASLEAGRERTFRGGRPRGKMVLYGGAIDSVVIILHINGNADDVVM